MKRFHSKGFPLVFAFFAAVVSVLYQGEMGLITAMVFFGGLGWSAVTCLFEKSQILWKSIYIVFAVMIPVLLVEFTKTPFPDRLAFRVVYLVLIGGILGIHLYRQVCNRRAEKDPESLD